MRVTHADRGKLLRMSGALGPVKADAVQGTMTFRLDPDGGGTWIVAEYVPAGYARSGPDRIAPAMDALLEAQIGLHAARSGREDRTGSEIVAGSRGRRITLLDWRLFD